MVNEATVNAEDRVGMLFVRKVMWRSKLSLDCCFFLSTAIVHPQT